MELRITNTKGEQVTFIYDDLDHSKVSEHKWYNRDGYAYTTDTKRIAMHRLILGITDRKVHVDHINFNTYDNRRVNLRAGTHRHNMLNRKPRGKSKYLGVYTINTYRKNNKHYSYIVAQIKINGKNKYLGIFKTEAEAARKYDEMAKIIHGEFANLNFK